MKKILIGLLLLTIVVTFLGRDLNPLQKRMFPFHDQTQVGRSQTFADVIKTGHIPPRIAPTYSFNLGYPLFNYYAPTAYWITSLFILVGVYSITALKLSFAMGLIIAFVGMALWLNRRFGYWASLLGATAYVTSPYMAVEIFVRGNISEVWFLALLPLSLWCIDRYHDDSSRKNFTIAALVVAVLLTAHNVLSLVGLALLVGYMFLHKVRKGERILFIALLLSSYFLIPSLLEMGQTYAVEVASKTIYQDHFLCLWQLWTSHGWSFGGSAAGCDADGFSFKLGKPHVVLALVGLLLGCRHILRAKKRDVLSKEFIAVGAITIISLFLTLYASEAIWHIFEKFLKVFQFPWRFLVFGVFGCAYLVGYAASQFKKKPYYSVAISIVCVLFVAFSMRYFTREQIPYHEYSQQYLTKDYLSNHIAFKIPEYLPRSADLEVWLSHQSGTEKPDFLNGVAEAKDKSTMKVLANENFYRSVQTDSQELYFNIHYAPYWKLTIDEQEFEPSEFDTFGRPLVRMSTGTHIVTAQYQQTPIELTANALSAIAVTGLLLFVTPYGRRFSKKK